jgi:hypothetical protein
VRGIHVRAGRWARILAYAAVARVTVALTLTGHVVVLLITATDALITARIGTRRIGFISGQLRDAVRESWEDSL